MLLGRKGIEEVSLRHLFLLLFAGTFLPGLESPLNELAGVNPLGAAVFFKWEMDPG